MARYWIEKPCSYLQDGKAVVHTRVPALPVELTDDIAAGLGDIVRAVNENPDVPDAPVEADPPKRGRGRTASDIAPAPEVDPAPEGDGS